MFLTGVGLAPRKRHFLFAKPFLLGLMTQKKRRQTFAVTVIARRTENNKSHRKAFSPCDDFFAFCRLVRAIRRAFTRFVFKMIG